MNSNMIFSLCSLFYMTLTACVYFSKKRVNNRENKLYSGLIAANIIGLSIELISAFIILSIAGFESFKTFSLKLILVYFLTWLYIFTLYIHHISTDNKKKIKKHVIILIYLFLLGITLFLPVYPKYSGNIIEYTYGPGVNYIYLLSGILIALCITLMLKNYRNIKNKKYIPLFIFIALGIIVVTIQLIFPHLLLIASAETFITTLMFHTVENPDQKLIEEIQRAKKFSDDSNYEKSLFLFNMTQDIRMPITNINKCVDNIYNLDNTTDIKEQVREIDSNAMELYNIVNNVLDVSNIDIKNVKVIDNKYNIKNLLKEVITSNKVKASAKKLEFRFNVDNSLPEYLYGDSIKLKQILNELISNAIKYTEVGYVSLNVTSVIKMDLCRLIIYVEDSGIGIQANKIDKLFNSNDIDLTDDKLTLPEIQKVLNIIGGTIVLNSEYHKGSKFTIVLDQKIDEENKSKELEVIEKYKDLIIEDKKILLVDDNESSVKMITKLSNKFNVNIDYVLSGKECLDKIRNKEKYDLILIDEEMPKLSGYDTMKKLKEIHHFNTPVVLLTKNSNLQFSEVHLNNGFSDLLIKPVDKTTLTNIYNKYLNEKD